MLLLGMCPTLATTTSAMNGLSMGLATTFVLICSNLVISLIKNLTPDMVRIPVFVVVIASFVTILQMLMQAYVPAIYATLGLYIPLIVVNCIILGRAEAFACNHGPVESLFDGAGMGLGFSVALTLLGAVRELLKGYFKPEFLNRLDEVVIFNPLGLTSIMEIVDIMFAQIAQVAAQKGITISLSDEAREYIAKAGFDPIYGARPLKRALYEEVEDKLAELILEDRLKDGSSVQFVLERDGDNREFIQAVYS